MLDITQNADKWLYYAVKAKKGSIVHGIQNRKQATDLSNVAYTTAERFDKAEEVQTMIKRYKELQL